MNKIFFLMISFLCVEIGAMDTKSNKTLEAYLSFAWHADIEQNDEQAYVTNLANLKRSNPAEAEILKDWAEDEDPLVRMHIASKSDTSNYDWATQGCQNLEIDCRIIPKFFPYECVKSLQEGQSQIISFGGKSIELIPKQQNSFAHLRRGSPETFQKTAQKYAEFVLEFRRSQDPSGYSRPTVNRIEADIKMVTRCICVGLAGVGLVAGYFTAKYFGFNPLSFFKILKLNK